ncbi:MAG: cytochrome c-type biogenesis protein CcmH [Gammaproteobacteria bacterium]|nr:cytochrome c-type biogenesis protein CcmH [Gammaproteobacteria bacterium]MDH5345845.1 cytochrome c-type biogenesis protein CcmH [Gammaproteobacteria bacterium]
MKWLAGFLCLLALPLVAAAIDVDKAFDDPDLQARYEAIIEEVRCVQCQNQTIKDSNALIANDLRREIRRLLSEGRTDAEVYDFLVQRYGEFVLYRPRMSGVSLLLWLAPGIFLVIGGIVVARVLRKRLSMPIDIDDDPGPGQIAG